MSNTSCSIFLGRPGFFLPAAGSGAGTVMASYARAVIPAEPAALAPPNPDTGGCNQRQPPLFCPGRTPARAHCLSR